MGFGINAATARWLLHKPSWPKSLAKQQQQQQQKTPAANYHKGFNQKGSQDAQVAS